MPQSAWRLTLDKARELGIDEAYLSVHKDNRASLAVQQHCGARIDHEDGLEYYTRISTAPEPGNLPKAEFMFPGPERDPSGRAHSCRNEDRDRRIDD